MMRAIIACLLFSLCTLRGAEVSAQLSQDTLQVGEAASFSLRVEGGAPDAPPVIPAVKGLVVNSRGQSQQIQIVNGQMSRSVVFNYVVGSHEAGVYDIPAVTVRVAGEEVSSQALKLTVRAAGEAGDEEVKVPEDGKKYGFLTFQLETKERKNVYPGEIAPVQIRAYFPMDARVSLNGPPRPDGSAFTLHNLSKEPTQTRELVNGVEYLAVTWTGGLSATKAGSYPASFTLEGTVAVRDTSRKRRQPSPFGGGMMDDFFAPMIQKEVSLTTPEPPEIEVTELPMEGRPDDFDGAIGQFDFDAVNFPGSLETGEPCQIEARIRGAGNFALLKEPHPLPAGEWKAYEGTGDFTAGDDASIAGSKQFRFSAVPLAPGEKELSLGFSYFDPEKGEYRSVKSVPRKVVIRGEAAVLPEVAEAKEVAKEEPKGPQLAPLKTELGSVEYYEPLSTLGWYYPVMGLSAGVSFLILVAGWMTSRTGDPARAARKAHLAAIQRATSGVEKAARSGDAVRFFAAVREALTLRVAERKGIKAEAVTLADLDGSHEPEIGELMKEADRLEYSGRDEGRGSLDEWNRKFVKAMEKLESRG